ncbi:MAG TPA: ArsC/Spx/MgsR family protein [Edaphocola sp.]|nr:ArsC/Spx/MgsR family protein [Edaphocola sp.]
MITILQIPECSKSRCAVEYSQQFPNLNIQLRNYIEQPLTKEELSALIKKLGVQAKDIFRISDYHSRADEKMPETDGDYINLLVENPELLQRPILISDAKSFIGRPPELILEFLKEQ